MRIDRSKQRKCIKQTTKWRQFRRGAFIFTFSGSVDSPLDSGEFHDLLRLQLNGWSPKSSRIFQFTQSAKKHVANKYCGDAEVRVSRMISLIRDARTVRRNAAAAFGTKPRFSTGRFRIVSVVDEYGFGRLTYRTTHAHSRTTTTPTLQYYNIFFNIITLLQYIIRFTRVNIIIYVHCSRNELHRWR